MVEKITEYLKDFQDSAGKRRRMRLPVMLPVLYGFATTAGSDFRQAMSVDISSSGIQIEVLDPSPEIALALGRKDSLMSMKFDMPERKELLETTGKLCWVHEIKAVKHRRLRVGVEFLPISLNGQIELMSHALLIARRRLWGKIGIYTGTGLLCVALIAASAIYISRNVIHQDLNASDRILEKMQNKVNELAKQKVEMEQELQRLKEKSGR